MSFDKDKPAASTSLRSSNPQLLANFAALETAANREHEFSTGGTTANQLHHKKGSARCYIQDSAPTTRVGGEAFNAQDNGSLWVDTNSDPDNQLNILTDYSVPTWTPASTEIIAAMIASARTWAATQTFDEGITMKTGKTLTVEIIKAVNGTGILLKNDAGDTVLTIGDDGTVTLADSSQLASSAAPTADADIVPKKYVDDQLSAAVPDDDAFGTWVHNPSGYATSVTAATDGIVCARDPTSPGVVIKGYTPTATQRIGSTGYGTSGGITMPVRKGNTWKVTGATHVYWLPIGG